VLLAEDVQKVVGNFALLFDDNYFSGGKYLPTTCPNYTAEVDVGGYDRAGIIN
jgi:hypothetical protein